MIKGRNIALPLQLDGNRASGTALPVEGAFLRMGSADVPFRWDTASTVFVSGNFVNDATSGATIGLRITLDSGGLLQTYSTAIHGQMNVTAQVRNPVALQGDMTFSSGKWVQGLGYGVGTYITLPDFQTVTGTFSGMNIEMAATSGFKCVNSTTGFSFLRFALSGNSTAKANIDDNGALFALDTGFTEGTGNLFSAGGDVAAAATLRINVGGTNYYILLGAGEST